MKKLITTLMLPLFLGACGGVDLPENRPSGKLSGVVHDNVLMNADVYIQSLDGITVGRGRTDMNGNYAVVLDSLESQPLKIIARNGRYKEEFSGKTVELGEGDEMYALVNYTQGNSVDTNITLFTTMAAGLAEFYIKNGAKPESAVNSANDSVSKLIGVDIVKVKPVDITNIDNQSVTLTNQLRYSFFTAAASPLTAWISAQNSRNTHEPYNSIMFIKRVYEDIVYDGILNGQGEAGRVRMGLVALDVDIYRNVFSTNVFTMANHLNNKSNIKAVQLLDAVREFNNNDHQIWGGAPIKELNTALPTITNVSIQEGRSYLGNVEFSASVSDSLAGVKEISFYIGDNKYDVADVNSPLVNIDTTKIPDGSYVAKIKVTSHTGGVSERTFNIKIANAVLTVSNLKPAEGEYIRGNTLFSADVTDTLGIKTVFFAIDDVNLEGITSDKTYSEVNTTNYLDGNYKFTVTAQNNSGVQKTESSNITIDNTQPLISSSSPNDKYAETYQFTAAANDNIGIKTLKLFLNEQLIQTKDDIGTKANTISQSFGKTSSNGQLAVPVGLNNIRAEVIDYAGNANSLSRNYYADYEAPALTLSNTPSTITSDFNLTIDVSDDVSVKEVKAYVGSKELSLDNSGKAFSNGRHAPTVKESSFPSSEGTATVRVVASDFSGKTTEKSFSANFQHVASNVSVTVTRKYGENIVNHQIVTSKSSDVIRLTNSQGDFGCDLTSNNSGNSATVKYSIDTSLNCYGWKYDVYDQYGKKLGSLVRAWSMSTSTLYWENSTGTKTNLTEEITY